MSDPDDDFLDARYKYIHFVEKEQKPKTTIWSCRNNRTGEELGEVRWHGPWRQYCYFPTVAAVYSEGCLVDIRRFMTGKNSQQKNARRSK